MKKKCPKPLLMAVETVLRRLYNLSDDVHLQNGSICQQKRPPSSEGSRLCTCVGFNSLFYVYGEGECSGTLSC